MFLTVVCKIGSGNTPMSINGWMDKQNGCINKMDGMLLGNKEE
jgi:hypothetical protein